MVKNYGGYQAYQKNKYETASPHRLITMLYEGAVRFAKQANNCISIDDLEGKDIAIKKFQDVIYELMGSLNFNEGKQVAENLYSLYDYTINLSMKSHLHKDTVYLEEAIMIITELKEAWVSIGKEVQING